MIALETLQHTDFDPLVGETFRLKAGADEVPLTLHEVKRLGHKRANAVRDPFSLAFRGVKGLRMPQQIYHFSHSSLGEMEIFIAQSGDGAQGSEFEAVFN